VRGAIDYNVDFKYIYIYILFCVSDRQPDGGMKDQRK
jgi:hypothetical protein